LRLPFFPYTNALPISLGGLTGTVADKSAVQFRMLNTSKGPAMWSPRCQSDRALYSKMMREELEKKENLHFRQDNVVDILTAEDGDRKSTRLNSSHVSI